MPQLDITTFPSQLFWLAVCFLALYFILSYLVIPKIVGVLESREQSREQMVKQASTYREEAEGILLEYEKALAQAREKARQSYQDAAYEVNLKIARQKTRKLAKLQERLHVAEQEIYRARMGVSSDMQSVAQEVAGEILQKLTGRIYSVDQLTVEKDKK